MKKTSAPASRCSRSSRTSRSIARPCGAHALDGRDLAVDREDRLDLQRRAEERLRGADPAAAAQVLERVDGEQDRHPLARRFAAASAAACALGAALGRVGGGDRHQPVAGAPVRESSTTIRSGSTPRSTSASRACSAARTVPEMPPERWIETTSSPRSSSGS